MSWTDHELPTGQVAQERIDLRTGRVTYDFCGTDATIDALDILALARVAEATLRSMTLPENAESGHSISRPSRWSAKEVADFHRSVQAQRPDLNRTGQSEAAYDGPLYCQCALDFHPMFRSPEGVALCRHCEKPMRPDRLRTGRSEGPRCKLCHAPVDSAGVKTCGH